MWGGRKANRWKKQMKVKTSRISKHHFFYWAKHIHYIRDSEEEENVSVCTHSKNLTVSKRLLLDVEKKMGWMDVHIVPMSISQMFMHRSAPFCLYINLQCFTNL